jgi:hypothetical protein
LNENSEAGEDYSKEYEKYKAKDNGKVGNMSIKLCVK